MSKGNKLLIILILLVIIGFIVLFVIKKRSLESTGDGTVTDKEQSYLVTDEDKQESTTVGNDLETDGSQTDNAEAPAEINDLTDQGDIIQEIVSGEADNKESDEIEQYYTTDMLRDNKNGEILPEIIYPANNGNKFDPMISGANMFKDGDYDFYSIGSAVLEWMYKMGIEDSCREIKVLEADTQGTESYKLELVFENTESKEVQMSLYDHAYYIQAYVDDAEIGFIGEP